MNKAKILEKNKVISPEQPGIIYNIEELNEGSEYLVKLNTGLLYQRFIYKKSGRSNIFKNRCPSNITIIK